LIVGYIDTRHHVVVASGNTAQLKFEALWDWAQNDAVRWEVVNSKSVNDECLVLKRIGSPAGSIEVAIRTQNSTIWYVSGDPAGALSSTGDFTTPLTCASPQAIVEAQHTPTTTHNKMVVIEYDDAIAIFEYGNSSENTTPTAVLVGLGLAPIDSAWIAQGTLGMCVLVNAPSLGGANQFNQQWFDGAFTQSRAVVLGEMRRPFSYPVTDTASVSSDVTISAQERAVALPLTVGSVRVAGGRIHDGGLVAKYIRLVSADATSGGVPGTRFDLGALSFVRVGAINTITARFCLVCEPGKAVK
jgi:hypothetical protein